MFRCVPLLLMLVCRLLAQDQASTLAVLADRSEVVVQARVVAVTDPDPSHRRVRFATEGLLKGQAPAEFRIDEPAARGCGQALFGLVPGTRLLAFLVRDGSGLRLAHSGARSLPVASPALVGHVRALLRTGGDAADRAEQLALALSSPDRRVRRDAALALPVLPGLEGAGALVRGRVLDALPRLLDRGDAAAAELLVAIARMRVEGALDLLVPRYLEGRDAGLAPLMREAIAAFGSDAVRKIGDSEPVELAGRGRAAELLAVLEVPQARPVLAGILSTAPASVRLRVATVLLSRGVRDLAGLVGEQVAQRARASLRTPPRYRSILQGGGR